MLNNTEAGLIISRRKGYFLFNYIPPLSYSDKYTIAKDKTYLDIIYLVCFINKLKDHCTFISIHFTSIKY